MRGWLHVWMLGLGLALGLGGCKGIANMPDLANVKPDVRFSDLKIKAIDFDGVDTRFVLEVRNPYPVGLKLTKNDWVLKLADQPFLDGSDSKGIDIAANGRSPLRIPVSMRWADAFRVASGVKGEDEIPFMLRTKLGFRTPVGNVEVPLRHEGVLPALHTPKISLKALRVEGINLAKQTANLALDLGVASDQGSNIGFDKFAYDIAFNGRRVINGRTSLAGIGDSETLTLPIALNLLELGGGIANAIKNKGTLDVGLGANIDVATPFGVVPLNLDKAKSLKLR